MGIFPMTANICDRFFDANGNQVQDMQVAPEPFPATVLMVNAMNTSAALSDLLRQGDIPRLLNQELRNRKPAQRNDDNRSSMDSSSFLRIGSRKTTDSSSSARAVSLGSLLLLLTIPTRMLPILGLIVGRSVRKRAATPRPHRSFLPRDCFPC
jgi:hypothetical protein